MSRNYKTDGCICVYISRGRSNILRVLPRKFPETLEFKIEMKTHVNNVKSIRKEINIKLSKFSLIETVEKYCTYYYLQKCRKLHFSVETFLSTRGCSQGKYLHCSSPSESLYTAKRYGFCKYSYIYSLSSICIRR